MYNAYVLYQLSYDQNATWQVRQEMIICRGWKLCSYSLSLIWLFWSLKVPVLSVLFCFVSLGNIITTMMVIPQKLKEKVKLKDRISRIHKFLHGTNCPESSEAVPPGQPEPSSSEKSSNGANSAEDDPNQTKKTLWTPIVMKLKYQFSRSTTKYRYYIYSNTSKCYANLHCCWFPFFILQAQINCDHQFK